MGVEEKEEVVVDVVVSVVAFGAGIATSLTGSLTGAVGELGNLVGVRLSLLVACRGTENFGGRITV